MKEIKTELIWKSCEDNPPTKTDEYIILTKDRRNGKSELFFVTYDADLFKIREILSEERLLAPEKVDRIQSVIDKFNNYTDNYVKSKIEKWSSHE